MSGARIAKVSFSLLAVLLAVATFQAVTSDRSSYDLSVAERIQDLGMGDVASFGSKMGVIGVAGVLGLAVIAWLWFRGRRSEAAAVALVGIFDLLNPLFREAIGRPRPSLDLVEIDCAQHGFSFPSGTAMHVVMFCGILFFLSDRLLRPLWLRIAAQAILAAWIPIMGLWVVVRGCHWPSDVVGGYIYGAFFLIVIVEAYWAYTGWRRSYPRDHVPQERLPKPIRPFAWAVRLIY